MAREDFAKIIKCVFIMLLNSGMFKALVLSSKELLIKFTILFLFLVYIKVVVFREVLFDKKHIFRESDSVYFEL